MSRRNNQGAPETWVWRRWIARAQQEDWAAQLPQISGVYWVWTERPNRTRILLEGYAGERSALISLVPKYGGRIRQVKASEWIRPATARPVRIGNKLEIVHEKIKKRASMPPRLHIPHGMAFGSGDHGTTHMLLGALTRHTDWSQARVLDLGTGSGVLALAARLFGAKKIVATDFDPESVRTSRQNEELNFSTPLIRWKREDVMRLRGSARYDLVLANLFSEILCQAAPQIAGCVAPGGQLWLSGILRSQQELVVTA
jgi:ribosomal protein L11 methyltransferase